MNRRMIVYVLGILLLCEAGLLLFPTAVALIFSENVVTSFLFSIAILVICGFIFVKCKPKDTTIYARDGLIIVSLGWIVLSLFGALPFFLSGEIPHYIDAVFETVSGFTTTGSSILSNVEALSKSMLFWRSFTHWIGGMGVLVFVMAVLPLSGGGGDIHLMRAESPGPTVEKLVPRSSKSARILYGIYLGLTALEFIILVIGRMPVFDAITITFGTAGTGGFGVLNSSIADYNVFCQGVITIFMALFGINFNFYFLLLLKRFKEAFKSSEIKAYLGIMAGTIIIITVNISNYYTSIFEAFRHAAFQVSSVMTTTGYSTADFDKWPELSRMLLLAVMCIGACAGSTGGGFKVSRMMIILKNAAKEVRSISHPRTIKVLTFDGKKVSNETVRSASAYLVIYVLIFAVSLIIISFDKMDTVSNVTGVIATLNNIGPGLGAVGPTGNFGDYNTLSKLVFIANMLLGRLEIFPIICLLTPSRQTINFFKSLNRKRGKM